MEKTKYAPCRSRHKIEYLATAIRKTDAGKYTFLLFYRGDILLVRVKYQEPNYTSNHLQRCSIACKNPSHTLSAWINRNYPKL